MNHGEHPHGPSPGSPFFIHRRVLLDTLRNVEWAFSGRLLDVGCNDKPYRPFFGARCDAWIGADLPTYAGGRTRPDLYSQAAALAFQASSFDTVLCTQMLDDLPIPGRLFEEAVRVLRAGGHLIVSAPQVSIPHNEPYDYYRFSRHALQSLAEAAGLEVCEMKPQGGAAALVGFMFSAHFPPLRGEGTMARILRPLFDRIVLAADRRWFRDSDTLGWVMVCRKPSPAFGAQP